MALGQVLAPELGGEEGTEAQASPPISGEHEGGHRIVGERAHEHLGHRRDVRGHHRSHRRVADSVAHAADGSATRSVHRRVVGEAGDHGERTALASEDPPPQALGVGGDRVRGRGPDDIPRAVLDLRFELARVPPRVPREQTHPDDGLGHRSRVGAEVDRPHRALGVHQRPPTGGTKMEILGRGLPGDQPDKSDQRVAGDRPAGEQLGGRGRPARPTAASTRRRPRHPVG